MIRNTETGFTLIEIVIALAVVAVLAGAMIPYAISKVESARVEATRNELDAIEDGLQSYYTDVRGLPSAGSGLSALVTNLDASGEWNGPYVNGQGDASAGIATDAWGDAYTYVPQADVRGISEPVDFLVISPGADRVLDSTIQNGRWRLDTNDDLVLIGTTSEIDRDLARRTDIQLDRITDALERYYTDVGSFPSGVDAAALAELVTSSASGWAGPYVGGSPGSVGEDAWGRTLRLRTCTRVNGQNVTGWILFSEGSGPPDPTVSGGRWTTTANDIYRVVSQAALDVELDRRRIESAKRALKLLAGEIYQNNPAASPPSGNLSATDPWGRNYRYETGSTYSGTVFSRGPDGNDDGGTGDDPAETLVWTP